MIAMGSSILFSYPEIATIAGVQGSITYAACSALPLMIFPVLAPIIRRKLPEGFILTMWVRERFGVVASLYLSFLTVATMFLYMVAELSALGQVIETLTGLKGLPVIIVEVVVTTIYTALGGFKVSFITDNIQGAMIGLLIIICAIAVGTSVTIDTALIAPSGLLEQSKLGYQLIFILLIGIVFSDMFLSNFWMRAFASKTDKDLWIGCGLASLAVFIILLLVSSTGFIAAWAGVWTPDVYGGLAFFLLLGKLPAWVVGFVVVMVVALSCAVFDSLQSAMVSTISNDVFRSKLPFIYIRVLVALITIPVIIIAVKKPSILQIFLISNIVATATLPSILLGLSERFYFLNGFDVICGGLGGMLSVFIFGSIYYGDAHQGAELMILKKGLYGDDWSAFGVFLVAPLGSLIFLTLAYGLRLSATWVFCKATGRPFRALDRPVGPPPDAKI
ncbi:hypothetical protein BZA05DRAFT_409124 [Tricharina praecox]|uniref:uncharacterized protein n=1 Tax=Tricharina praecox TaxID=43433 RepID=UPI00221EE975|nr:uncharacterized protein BZA05DRAFT_409124 [Tricharina praecox]KAI5844702.1 hypothetical protein BZA05DRAFT_409124 [Tricharina praecox]